MSDKGLMKHQTAAGRSGKKSGISDQRELYNIKQKGRYNIRQKGLVEYQTKENKKRLVEHKIKTRISDKKDILNNTQKGLINLNNAFKLICTMDNDGGSGPNKHLFS